MPRKVSIDEALTKVAHLDDEDSAPNSTSFRMPLWLYRMAMRAGRLLKLDEPSQALRAVLYLGARLVLAGRVSQITPDITSAANGDSTRGPGPEFETAGEVMEGPLSAKEVLRATPTEELVYEIQRRNPRTLVCEEAELVEKLLAWQERQWEEAKTRGVRRSLGLR